MQIMENSLNPYLPDKLTANMYGEEYHYIHSRGILGDPNFVVYLNLQFPDMDCFGEYLNRLGLGEKTPIQIQNDKYYLLQGTEALIAEYTNDEIYDGCFFDFEAIVVNDERNSVTHIVAHVWDYWKNEMLLGWLAPFEQK